MDTKRLRLDIKRFRWDEKSFLRALKNPLLQSKSISSFRLETT